MPSGYNIALTIVSLVAAIALTGTGLTIGISPHVRHGRWIGGAIVGGGIAVMHYTGMAAFEIAGRVVWDLPLVAASIALGGLFGAAALPVALRANTIKWKALDPTFGRPNAVAVAKRTERPHAAMLFVDFMLSPEGQELIHKRNRVPASTAVQTNLNKFPFHMIDPVVVLDESQKWEKLWSEKPLPGFTDIFALVKKKLLRIEGDLHPFMTHLLYFKGVLAAAGAAPRSGGAT